MPGTNTSLLSHLAYHEDKEIHNNDSEFQSFKTVFIRHQHKGRISKSICPYIRVDNLKVFNFKLGSFDMLHSKYMVYVQPLLDLETRPRFSQFNDSLSIDCPVPCRFFSLGPIF
jgi:hypothetical protein